MTPSNRNGTSFAVRSYLYLSRALDNLLCSLTWKELLTGILFSFLLSAIIVTGRFQSIKEYKVGDIVEADIRATQEITIADPMATEKKRAESVSSVPAIFRWNTTSVSAAANELHLLFSQGRSLFRQYEENKGTKLPAALDEVRHRALWNLVVSDLSPRQIQTSSLLVFFHRRFAENLESDLVGILIEVLQNGMIKDRDQSGNIQNNGAILIRTDNREEIFVRDLRSLRDVRQVRSELRQRLSDLVYTTPEERYRILEFLDRYLQPNILFDSDETDKRRLNAAQKVETISHHFKRGRIIARQGDEISPIDLLAIQEIRKRDQPQEIAAQLTGLFVLISMYLYVSWRYTRHFYKNGKKFRTNFLLFWITLLSSLFLSRILFNLCGILSERTNIPFFQEPSDLYFAIPFSFGAILISLLADTNIALFFLLSFSIFIGIPTDDITLSVYSIFGGLTAVFGIRKYKERTAILKLGLNIGIVNAMTAFGLFLVQAQHDQVYVLMVRSIGGLFGGLFACMLASLLLPALETIFHITTDLRLLELANLQNPLLRRLALDAPGTYHHSISAGTLGEAAAEAIGANPLLVRVGAYYHDIGKVGKSEYFVENQVYTSNKHENLSPHLSRMVLTSHVKEGLEMAQSMRIPQPILDMIPQHHGTRIMSYFLQKAKSDPRTQEQDISDDSFRYPGPKPQTKEAAILMIVDSVEAASRTLEDPTIAQIQGMIQRILRSVIEDEQLDECDITMKDLKLIEESLLKVLGGMFHHRIEYPGYNFQGTNDTKQNSAS